MSIMETFSNCWNNMSETAKTCMLMTGLALGGAVVISASWIGKENGLKEGSEAACYNHMMEQIKAFYTYGDIRGPFKERRHIIQSDTTSAQPKP